MSLASILTSVRYYTQSDPYYYTADNRPLTDLATRDTEISNMLDRRTGVGEIVGSGTPSVTQSTNNWTVALVGVGDYTITHNLGDTNYIAQISMNGAAGVGFVFARTANTIRVKTVNMSGTATHLNFFLTISGV